MIGLTEVRQLGFFHPLHFSMLTLLRQMVSYSTESFLHKAKRKLIEVLHKRLSRKADNQDASHSCRKRKRPQAMKWENRLEKCQCTWC